MSQKETIHFDIIDDVASSPASEPVPEGTVPEGTAKINTHQRTFAEFEQQIKTFIETHKPSLTILTPAYGSQVYVNYTHSLINTINMCNLVGLPVRVEFCRNDSLVSRARNNLVAKALTDKETTHVMFIDADIGWSPIDVLNMLMADKDIVGGAYPLKSHEWERLLLDGGDVAKKWVQSKNESELKDKMSDIEIIKQKLLRYNINLLSNELTINENLMEVRHTATGFIMIKRGVFEQMIAQFPQLKYVDNTGFLTKEENEFAYALFEPSICEGIYMSEDWTFCERWVNVMEPKNVMECEAKKNKVYIDVGVQLSHIGLEEFKGAFLSLLV